MNEKERMAKARIMADLGRTALGKNSDLYFATRLALLMEEQSLEDEVKWLTESVDRYTRQVRGEED
jgi:hypothetical protein